MVFDQSIVITLLIFTLSQVANAAPYSLEKRKGGGGGGSSGSHGGASRGATGGSSGGGMVTWKIVVIVLSIVITIVFLLWFLPKYVFPRYGWWQRRLERKRLKAEEAQKKMDKMIADLEQQKREEEIGGSNRGVAI